MQLVSRAVAAALALASASVVAGSTPLASQEHHGGHPVSDDAGISVRHDSAASEFTVRVGPLRLPEGAGHGQVAQAPNLHVAVPVDGWLVSYRPRLVDGGGERVPGRLLHHVAFWSEERPDFLCPGKDEHVFGSGGEMNVWPALPGVGYPVREGDRIRVNTMFHNPTDTAYGEVYLEVDVGYRTRSGAAEPLAPVYPVWLDVRKCGASSYDLAPGTNLDSATFVMPYAGRLLGLGGHLHDYGRSVRVVDLTRDREVATLEARLDELGRILSMPVVPFLATGGYELAEGDSLRVSARYENPTGRRLEAGAMGIAVGYFRPAAPEALAELRRDEGSDP